MCVKECASVEKIFDNMPIYERAGKKLLCLEISSNYKQSKINDLQNYWEGIFSNFRTDTIRALFVFSLRGGG